MREKFFHWTHSLGDQLSFSFSIYSFLQELVNMASLTIYQSLFIGECSRWGVLAAVLFYFDCIPFFVICIAGTSGKRSSSSSLTHFYKVYQYRQPMQHLSNF
jgi:hypothetical protein